MYNVVPFPATYSSLRCGLGMMIKMARAKDSNFSFYHGTARCAKFLQGRCGKDEPGCKACGPKLVLVNNTGACATALTHFL